MELEWSQDFPWPSGWLNVPEGTRVEYMPTWAQPLQLYIGNNFRLSFNKATVEQLRQALLTAEERVLSDRARERAIERRERVYSSSTSPTRERRDVSEIEEI